MPRLLLLLLLLLCACATALAQPAPRDIDLTASDGTKLKATYFAAAKAGPAVILLQTPAVRSSTAGWADLQKTASELVGVARSRCQRWAAALTRASRLWMRGSRTGRA